MGRPRRAWGPRALAVGALLSILPLAAWQPAPPAMTSALPRHVMAEHAHASLALAGPAEGITDSQAATLRVRLNVLLAEHVYLAARASGAALAGQQAGFEAAAGALVGGNSNDIADAIGAAYGPEAREVFLPLWNSHIGMVVDYVKGLAADDQAMQQKAVNDLVGYTEDFGAFLSGANENLPQDVVAELVRTHVLTLKTVVDAQKARDQVAVYDGLRTAMGHMSMVADPLAGATAKKLPDKFPGDPMSSGASLRVALNNLLAEHVYLATSAALGGLSGNEAQFTAAAKSLDDNSIELSKAIAAAYGPEAEAAFLPLWRSHIGMVVDYVKGKSAKDQAMQDKAVNDLVGYTQDFAAFLSGANENLPKDAVAELVKVHALTLKDVIDAQAAGDPVKHFAALRMAAGHMGMIADPLAEATAAKFPDKFGAGAAAMPSHGPGMSHGASAPAQAGMQAEIKQFRFSPDLIEVAVGTTVTWTNQDGAQHSVTRQGGGFDSGLFQQGGTFSYTFDQPGTYDYVCTRHSSMQGSVKVS
jgi:plastocyanin